MKKKKAGEIIDNAYFELVRRFPLKPIASDRELDRAIQTVNELVDRGLEHMQKLAAFFKIDVSVFVPKPK